MWIVLALGGVVAVLAGRAWWRRARDPAVDYVSPAWLQAAIRERRQ